jgi:hypothetical protein
MITVDHEQGLAREVGEVWRGDDTSGTDIIVDFCINEDNALCIACGSGDDYVSIVIPVERVKRLLR